MEYATSYVYTQVNYIQASFDRINFHRSNILCLSVPMLLQLSIFLMPINISS